MEDDTSIAEGVICYSMAQITLKEKAIVSQRCSLCTGTHDYTSKTFQLYALPITIGERSWVCAEAFIGPGVTIGTGSVIGARSVVTRDMPEWTVCAGNPCKPVKARPYDEGPAS
jgi:putative colanic acid biosynthesis acetyltransferase WcaF